MRAMCVGSQSEFHRIKPLTSEEAYQCCKARIQRELALRVLCPLTLVSYADDLPYWVQDYGKPHLVIPYTLDNNDIRFATAQGFNCGDQFFAYLRDAFDVLYEEGETAPKMMNIGLHCRLISRPRRAASLAHFLDYVQARDRVWLCRRIDIARHWHQHHTP